jgi:hypothetical protein
VLAFCADHGRVLVTQDRRTMAAHFCQFVARRESPGVILVRRRAALGIVIDELHMIWQASVAEEWENQVAWIPL